VNIMSLLSIAKRQIRKGTTDHVIADILRQADNLEIELLPANTSPQELVERAKKEQARDVLRARRAAFRMFVDNRERNRENCSERAGLFDEIVSVILEEYPLWESVYARGIANTARVEFDLAVAVKPIERITDAYDRLPVCVVCRVSRADTKRLNLESWNVEPMCQDCASAQVRELT
jgi:hypothetical protein